LQTQAQEIPAQPKSGHILIMDDEQMIRDLSVETLESFGHTTDTAKDGTEALEKYALAMKKGDPFDIIIMDLTIPDGMGGQEAIAKLLNIDSNAQVIVASGYSNDSAMSNYAKLGFKARLVKPYQLEELEQTINKLMGEQ